MNKPNTVRLTPMNSDMQPDGEPATYRITGEVTCVSRGREYYLATLARPTVAVRVCHAPAHEDCAGMVAYTGGYIHEYLLITNTNGEITP